MSAAVQKMRGVESVEVATKAGVVRVVMLPENRVRLEAIRDAVKGVGLTPGDARVQVRGTPESAEGKWQFRIAGLDQTATLELDPATASEIARLAGAVVLLDGVIPPPPDPRTPLTIRVRSIRSEPGP